MTTAERLWRRRSAPSPRGSLSSSVLRGRIRRTLRRRSRVRGTPNRVSRHRRRASSIQFRECRYGPEMMREQKQRTSSLKLGVQRFSQSARAVKWQTTILPETALTRPGLPRYRAAQLTDLAVTLGFAICGMQLGANNETASHLCAGHGPPCRHCLTAYPAF